MNQDQEIQFPEFLPIIEPEKQKLIESPPKQKSLSQKKRQLIEKITIQKYQDKKQNDESDEFTCFICREYFVKPVTVKCGHSFCDFCLQEYFLFSKNCPICQQNIRGSTFTYNNTLNEFIDGFIRNHHRGYLEFYQQRVEKYKTWKMEDKPMSNDFRAGLTVDVRDENYVWCKGIIVRVISKIGDPIKFLKIQYKTQNNLTKQQEMRWTSQRVAPGGFYTERKEIPKYKEQLNQLNKNKSKKDTIIKK